MLSAFVDALAATLQRISPTTSATWARAIKTTFRQKRAVARHQLHELSRISSSTLMEDKAGDYKSGAGRVVEGLATAEKRRQAAALQSALSRAKPSCEFAKFVFHFDSAFVAMPTLVMPARCTASISAINFCTGNSRSGRITTATSGLVCFNWISCAGSVSKSIT